MKKKILLLAQGDQLKLVRATLFNEFKLHNIPYERKSRECIETEDINYYFFPLFCFRNMITFATKYKQMDIVYSSSSNVNGFFHEEEQTAFLSGVCSSLEHIIPIKDNLPLVIATSHPAISSIPVYKVINRSNYQMKKVLLSEWKELRRTHPRRYFQTESEAREYIRSLALSKIEEYNRLIQQEMKIVEKFSDSLS